MRAFGWSSPFDDEKDIGSVKSAFIILESEPRAFHITGSLPHEGSKFESLPPVPEC